MTSNEEKIKAFLNDEKKMKALLNDEEFINKVSSEEATAETYKEEFKKFDIELSDDEANQMKDTIVKIFKTPTEELRDEFLKGVSGGGYDDIDNDNARIGAQVSQGTSSGQLSGTSSSELSEGGIVGAVLGTIGGIAVGVWGITTAGYAIASAVYKKKAEKYRSKDLATANKYLYKSDELRDEALQWATFGKKDYPWRSHYMY